VATRIYLLAIVAQALLLALRFDAWWAFAAAMGYLLACLVITLTALFRRGDAR
jgi:hypothetical protein